MLYTPGANAIKLFTAVSYAFAPGKPFQPSLLFVGKARSIPYSGAPKTLPCKVSGLV